MSYATPRGIRREQEGKNHERRRRGKDAEGYNKMQIGHTKQAKAIAFARALTGAFSHKQNVA